MAPSVARRPTESDAPTTSPWHRAADQAPQRAQAGPCFERFQTPTHLHQRWNGRFRGLTRGPRTRRQVVPAGGTRDEIASQQATRPREKPRRSGASRGVSEGTRTPDRLDHKREGSCDLVHSVAGCGRISPTTATGLWRCGICRRDGDLARYAPLSSSAASSRTRCAMSPHILRERIRSHGPGVASIPPSHGTCDAARTRGQGTTT